MEKPEEEGGQPGKPDMAELMLKLAEIRRSTRDSGDTSGRLVRHAVALALFLAAAALLPMLFARSCNPPG